MYKLLLDFPSAVITFSPVREGGCHINFFGGRGLRKSCTSYLGQYSDLSEGATKTKWLKVGSLIMFTY